MIKKWFRKLFNLDKVKNLEKNINDLTDLLQEYESLLADYKYLLVGVLLNNNSEGKFPLFEENIIDLYDIDYKIIDDELLLQLVTTQGIDEY